MGLSDKETTLPTHHSKIMIAKVVSPLGDEVMNMFESMTYGSLNGMSDMDLVAKLKSLIPEYKSENSEYTSLDS